MDHIHAVLGVLLLAAVLLASLWLCWLCSVVAKLWEWAFRQIRQPRPIRVPSLNDEFAMRGGCECSCKEVLRGPAGGAAQTVICKQCSRVYILYPGRMEALIS